MRGDFFTAPDTDFIRAVRAFAALPPVDEQEIKIPVPRQTRGFDGVVGMIPRQPLRRGVGVGAQAGCRIELD